VCPIIPDVAEIFDYDEAGNSLKIIIDSHDVSQHFDFSGYF